MWSYASSHCEEKVLKVECRFGYPVSGSLDKSSKTGKLLNMPTFLLLLDMGIICALLMSLTFWQDSWLNVVFLDSSLGYFVTNLGMHGFF